MIGVCIKYYHENYGGMLQAYATIKLLDRYNIEYEIIRYKKKKNIIFVLKTIPRLFNRILINDKYEAIQKKISIKKHPEFKKNNIIRNKAFAKFRDAKFADKVSPIYYGYDDLKNSSKKYSAVLTGSDQLWSPAGLPTNFYNLMFVDDNIKKISYASSFGVKYIPWYQKKRTAAFLKRIEFISMRENSGKNIVKELTSRNVPVVLDPVFMFDKDEWKKLVPNKQNIKEKYIFAYLLGANKEHRDAIKKLAKEKGLKIVTLRHLDQFVESDEHFGDYAPYDVGPEEFLNLIRNAEYICTDSYHGTIFSIIHKKQFIIFNRYDNKSKHSKNSRIDTLCENFGISNRRYNGDIMELLKENVDYKTVKKKYLELRKKSEKYIETAIKNRIGVIK